MKKIILSMALAMLPLVAQMSLPNVKLVSLKHVGTNVASELLMPFMGEGSPVQVRFSGRPRLVVLSGLPEAIAVVEEYIKKFDVPPPEPSRPAPRNIEVTAYMLFGNSEPDSGDLAPPAELAGVVKQLRGMFPFKNYRLAETMIVRARENNPGEASGLMAMPGAGDAARGYYTFKYTNAAISSDEKGRTIRLDRVRVNARVPYPAFPGAPQVQYHDVGVITDVDLREGQKVVVGKTSGPSMTSLFVVLTTRLVE